LTAQRALRALLALALTLLIALPALAQQPAQPDAPPPDTPEFSLPQLPILPQQPAQTGSPALAWQALKRAFSGFLDREPLGFDLDLPSLIAREVLDTAQAAHLILLHPPTTVELVAQASPIALLLLVLLLLSALDHHATRIAHTWQARIWLPAAGRWATDGARAVTLLLGQLAPMLLLTALCFLTLHAAFGAALWVRALIDTLLVLLSLRAASALIEIAYALDPLGVPDEHARTIRRIAHTALIAAAYGFCLLQILESFQWLPQARALLIATMRTGAAALPIYLLYRKPAIMSLMPAQSASRSYLAMRSAVARHYNTLLGMTSALLALRALGYSRASSFILTRGYGLFLLLLATFSLGARMRAMIDQRVQSMSADDPQLDTLLSIRRLSTLVLIAITTDAALKILALDEAITLLLRTPIFRLQQLSFSVYNAISAALIVSVAVLLSQLLRYLLNARVYPALKIEVGVAYAINTLISYAVVVIGIFLVLVALGVNLSALTVVLASLSVGIGFGLQTMTENLIAGFIVLFGRAVRKGDYVTIEGTFGRVEAVGARSVIVRTPDNVDLLVPSKALVASSITNWTYRDSLVRLHLPVGVDYNSTPREVERILLDAAKRHELVCQQPPPEVWFTGFGDNALNFELLVYFDCRKITDKRLAGQLYFHIWDVLKEANINIPFPQRVLHAGPSLLDAMRPYTDKGDPPS
jgi:small-conductance mechanosensitive channel